MWIDNAPTLYIKKTFVYLDLLEREHVEGYFYWRGSTWKGIFTGEGARGRVFLLEREHVEGYFYPLFVGNCSVLPPSFRCC